MSPSPSLPEPPFAILRPYVSVTLLRLRSSPDTSLRALRNHLKNIVTTSRKYSVDIVGDGYFEGGNYEPESRPYGIVYALSAPPSWITADTDIIDVTHHLALMVLNDDLVAVHCEATISDKLVRWVDVNSHIFAKIDEGVLNATLLSGEAKSLWLRGVHARRSTLADSKVLSGPRLQDALRPIEDGTFAMGSARAELKVDPAFAALSGIIGTTPRKSRVWFRPTVDFQDFLQVCGDLLAALKATIVDGRVVVSPFPWLAEEVYELAPVSMAYDVSWSGQESLPDADRTIEIIDSMAQLEMSQILTHGRSGSDFLMEVGTAGRIGGSIACSPVRERGDVRLRLGYDGTPFDAEQVAVVLRALEQVPDLLTIYYESGHTIAGGRIWRSQFSERQFPEWRWADFSGFSLMREKPMNGSPQDIHDAIGLADDTSLFCWVVRHLGADGLLTCDDGPNEAADFVHLSHDDLLTLIHVKAASSKHPGRQVSVGNFEVVVGQATKNIRYLDSELLASHLEESSVSSASWLDGQRVASSSDLIAFLRLRGASARSRIVIVQPHMTQSVCYAARRSAGGPQHLRMRLLDTMLNSARGSITAVGSDLQVIGAS